MCFKKGKKIVKLEEYRKSVEGLVDKAKSKAKAPVTVVDPSVQARLYQTGALLETKSRTYVKLNKENLEKLTKFVDDTLNNVSRRAFDKKNAEAIAILECLRYFIEINFLDGNINLSPEEERQLEAINVMGLSIERLKNDVMDLRNREKDKKQECDDLRNTIENDFSLSEVELKNKNDDYQIAQNELVEIQNQLNAKQNTLKDYSKKKSQSVAFLEFQKYIEEHGDDYYKQITEEDIANISQKVIETAQEVEIQNGIIDDIIGETNSVLNSDIVEKDDPMERRKKNMERRKKEAQDDKKFAPPKDEYKDA